MNGSTRIQRIKGMIEQKSVKESGQMDRRGFLKLLGVGAAAAGVAASGLPGCAGLIPGSGKNFAPADGIIPPMVTPFTDEGEIDWNVYEQLIDWHISKGVDGLFVVCGSGEYFSLTEDEAVRMAEVAVRRANGRIHILCGSANHRRYEQIDDNIRMTRRVADTGVDGCFITPPARVPDSFEPDMQQHVLDYLVRIHDATNHPLYIYEIPGMPFRFMFAPETLGTLSRCERYIGMKDTSTREHLPEDEALATVRAKLAAVGDRLKIIQASNLFLLPSLQMGCSGGVNTVSNVAPGLFVKLYSLWRNGDIENARLLQARIAEVKAMLEAGPYIPSAKFALSQMGIPIDTIMRRRRNRGPRRRDLNQEQIQTVQNMIALIRRSEDEFEIS